MKSLQNHCEKRFLEHLFKFSILSESREMNKSISLILDSIVSLYDHLTTNQIFKFFESQIKQYLTTLKELSKKSKDCN